MPTAEKVLKDIEELRVLRKALAQAAEYQPGRVRVGIQFRQTMRDSRVLATIEEAAMTVVKGILTTAEMRTRISAVIAARIAVLEARYPGLVD